MRRTINSISACRLFCSCFVVVGLLGCSESGPPRKPVFGTVSSAAANQVNGGISFLPAAGTKGPSATGAVVEGKFRFAAEDGPVPGQYQVLIVPKIIKDIPKSDAAKNPDATKAKPEPKEYRLDVTVPETGPFELNLKVGS